MPDLLTAKWPKGSMFDKGGDTPAPSPAPAKAATPAIDPNNSDWETVNPNSPEWETVEPKNLKAHVLDAAHSVKEDLWDAPKAALSALADNPTQTIIGAGRDALAASGHYVAKTGDAIKRGDWKGAVRNAPGMLPVVGPMVEGWTDQIENGDYGKAAGHIGTFFLLPKVPGAVKAAPKVARAVKAELTTPGTGSMIGGVAEMAAGVSAAMNNHPIVASGLGASGLSRVAKGWTTRQAAKTAPAVERPLLMTGKAPPLPQPNRMAPTPEEPMMSGKAPPLPAPGKKYFLEETEERVPLMSGTAPPLRGGIPTEPAPVPEARVPLMTGKAPPLKGGIPGEVPETRVPLTGGKAPALPPPAPAAKPRVMEPPPVTFRNVPPELDTPTAAPAAKVAGPPPELDTPGTGGNGRPPLRHSAVDKVQQAVENKVANVSAYLRKTGVTADKLRQLQQNLGTPEGQAQAKMLADKAFEHGKQAGATNLPTRGYRSLDGDTLQLLIESME